MDIQLNNDYNQLYNVKTFIHKDYLVIQLESNSGKYSKRFKLDELQGFNRYFRQSVDLELAKKDLIDLFEGKYIINEIKEENNAIIYFEKKEIKFILENINNNGNIAYDSLSAQMKKIIDNNQLILGIDLGTTYSSAAVMIDNNIVMIRNSLGSTTTPSYISFLSKNEVYVGELSKLLPSNDKNIIFNTKRLLGKSIDDNDIKELSKKLPFSLKKDEKYNLLKIVINFNEESNNKENNNKEEEFYPEQISALILRKIIKDSEFYLSQKIGKDIKINNCVLTVPAYFNQNQREATLNAAKIIGLNVKKMINEPTAACLAYAFNSLENTDKKMIVIDFGGGTLDITLLRFKKDKDGIYCDVKFTYGNSNFGGEDFDNLLMSKCIENCFKSSDKESKIYKESDKNQPQIIRLKRACERAKIKLSSFYSTKIFIKNNTNFKGIDFSLNKKDFLKYCKQLFDKFTQIIDDFICQSKVNKNEISEVILIGGSTLIPEIRKIIKEKFKCSNINYNLDPKEIVAMGASIRGAKFYNISSIEDIKLFDVTNLSFGVRLKGNLFKRIIPRSTKIPFQNTDLFKTTLNDQDFAVIKIFEGENKNDCDKNLLLGKFIISELPKKKEGEVKIEVKFEIDDNSILEVTASEVSNPSHIEKLVIKKQNDLVKIMEQLKEREKGISFYENKYYNKIKFSIMELEDNLKILKSKKIINPDSIEKESKNILEKIGKFLIDCDDFSNLYISFIKLYFYKLCEFYQTYNTKNNKNLKKIKEELTKLFDKIYINNKDIIFEIIEEDVDADDIYINFIYFIMQSLYDEINTIFLFSNNAKDSKDRVKSDEILNDLSRAKSLIKVCKDLIDKYSKDKTKLNNITIKDLEKIQLKIDVREAIIKINNKKIFLRFVYSKQDQIRLKELYDKYYDCTYADQNDLIDLGKMVNDATQCNEDDNFSKEWKKAEKFVSQINCRNINDDIICTIHEILENYPYDKEGHNSQMWDEFYNYKEGGTTQEDYLLYLKGKYQEKMNDINTDCIEQSVFTSILEFFNRISI